MKALIFGAAGQDGTYLIEHLIDRGHEVFATTARYTPPPSVRPGVTWLHADVRYADQVVAAVTATEPDVVFNLAAVTTPGAGWLASSPADVAAVNAMGALHVVQAVDRHAPGAQLVHASSSAIYDPRRYGLYGTSKVFAHEVVSGYRAQGLWAANAVLYSHTSPLQDPRFLVPQICRAAVRIGAGADERIALPSPWSRRDWMHARDAVRALLTIAERGTARDYDVGSGKCITVDRIAGVALSAAGVPDPARVLDRGDQERVIEWPADVKPLLDLGWRPEIPMEHTVAEMMAAAEAERLKAET